jgi:hypothetical protein
MRHAILMLTTLTFSLPTGLQAVPRQADAEAVANPVSVTSATRDVTPVVTTGTFDTDVVVDPFRAHMVTICTSLAKGVGLDPSGLAGPIVRCEMPVNTTEQWALNAKPGLGDHPEVAPPADRPSSLSNERSAK